MVFEWKIDGRKWPFIFVSGEATSIKREEVGAPLGACSPLGLAAPLSYKRRRWRPLSRLLTLSHFLSYPLVGISPLACSTSRTWCLGEALSNFSLHHHHHVIVLLEVPEDPLLPLPTGARGRGRPRSIRVTEYGGAARS